jgi:pimeloyl-ACP methyl ester carboxylesterase
LRLHYRDWAGPDAWPALLCLPGLTRSAADFAALAARLAGRWRVVAVDLRGRGDSAWPKDSLSYVPLTYRLDIGRLIEAAGLKRFVVIGSSVNGLLAMQLSMGHRDALAGVVLNDIGPEMTAAGIVRLRANVGRGGNWPTFVHAARDLATRNAALYPDWQLADWLGFARRLCRVSPTGRVIFDYDPRIAEPFRLPGHDAGADHWAAFEALAGLPVLSVRGGLSDVLSAEVQARMLARMPGLRTVVVPRVGHAPTLGEPEAVAAIDALLGEVKAQALQGAKGSSGA